MKPAIIVAVSVAVLAGCLLLRRNLRRRAVRMRLRELAGEVF